MRKADRKRWIEIIAILGAFVITIGCAGETPKGDDGDGNGDGDGDGNSNGDQWQDELDNREVDYSAALRIAALKLTGALPTLSEINSIANTPDVNEQRGIYRDLIDSYIARPTFARQLFNRFQYELEMGGNGLNAGPAFALDLAMNNRDFREILTAQSGNCPTVTFDGQGIPTVTPADCATGIGVESGILTNQEMLSQQFSNMAFKRVRWVYETFLNRALPGRLADEPIKLDDGSFFEGRWPFLSISGKHNLPDTDVDFTDTSSVVCANCHVEMNHIAPILAHFDKDGVYSPDFAVVKPSKKTVVRVDYLPEGEPTEWLPGLATPDIASLGAAMAADPEVQTALVKRVIAWAQSHPDAVDSAFYIPDEVAADLVQVFVNTNFNYVEVVREAFLRRDFIKF